MSLDSLCSLPAFTKVTADKQDDSGCLCAGVTAVPVLPARHARDLPRLSAICADSQARFVLTTSRMASRSRELCERTAGLAGLNWQTTDDVSLELAHTSARYSGQGMTRAKMIFIFQKAYNANDQKPNLYRQRSSK